MTYLFYIKTPGQQHALPPGVLLFPAHTPDESSLCLWSNALWRIRIVLSARQHLFCSRLKGFPHLLWKVYIHLTKAAHNAPPLTSKNNGGS